MIAVINIFARNPSYSNCDEAVILLNVERDVLNSTLTGTLVARAYTGFSQNFETYNAFCRYEIKTKAGDEVFYFNSIQDFTAYAQALRTTAGLKIAENLMVKSLQYKWIASWEKEITNAKIS